MTFLASLLFVVGCVCCLLGAIGLLHERRSPSTTSPLVTWCIPLALCCGLTLLLIWWTR